MNYVFDLYGTLVDIDTDEADRHLWKVLADMYNRYGLCVSPGELRELFLKLEKKARKKTAERLSTADPEIRLEEVFLSMYQKGKKDPKRGETGLPEPDERWADMIANLFRALSIKRIRLFPDTIKMLDRLKNEGHRVYLLSNAQKVFTMPEIEYLGLKDKFDRIYISSDLDLKKPEVRFLERLIADEGLKREETVMVGNDPESDMGMAALCGVKGLFFNSWKLSDKKIKKRIKQYVGDRDIKDFLKNLKIVDRW